MIVVVAHQYLALIVHPDRLRAAGEVGRRAVERQCPGRQVAASGELGEALIGRHQLRHVGLELGTGLEIAGAGGVPLGQEPLAVTGPEPFEVVLPLLARRHLSDGFELELHGRGGRFVRNSFA